MDIKKKTSLAMLEEFEVNSHSVLDLESFLEKIPILIPLKSKPRPDFLMVLECL
jgi:hypothetical protein